MQRILRKAPAQDDRDHIPLIVMQNPQVPSRIAHLIDQTGESPAPALAEMSRALEGAGAEALAMPCCTAHAFVDAIKVASSLPFLDMRDATVATLPEGLGRIGILASPAVRLVGVFDAAFERAGLEAVWPKDDGVVLALIQEVKRGETGADLGDSFVKVAAQLAQSCDHILIACTELSLLTSALPEEGWTDALDCLVAEICAFSQAKAR
jgi:aspartate racemase